MKILFPRRSSAALTGVLINTAGGVTGGDEFLLDATAGEGTELTLTTQAAERAYRALPGEVGCVRNRVRVKDGARLNWVPQETIIFQGADLDRRLDVEVSEASRLLLCEALVFGRTAMGEVLTSAKLRDRITVSRNGVPLFDDRIVIQGDIAAHLARPYVADGAGAIASVLYYGPDAEAHLHVVRDTLTGKTGVSLIRPDLLFIRALATDSFYLRATLIPALTRLLCGPLPRPWMI